MPKHHQHTTDTKRALNQKKIKQTHSHT